jgi:predicted extracellular nuclease
MVADQIAADDPAIVYTPYLMQGQAWSDIEVGYLVRDTVVVNSLTQFGFDETFDCDGNERTTYDRPPLVLDAEYAGAGEPFPITVIANHLRSLSGIEDDLCVRLKRHEQALRLSEFVQTLQSADPEIRLVVTGDFNAFQFTDGYVDVMGQITGNLDPLGALIPGSDEVDPDLTNEIFLIPGAERYSYIYMGNAQGFDHVLTSASLDPWVSGTEYSRGNADAPAALFPDWSTPMRVSDHDGVVLYLFNDADLDGVPNDLDMCPGTVIPESVPTQRLGTNRWALVDDDGVFDTSPPRGGGGGPALLFTIDDTAGCSCEQIIGELDLGKGHEKFGCSSGAMEDWIFSLP